MTTRRPRPARSLVLLTGVGAVAVAATKVARSIGADAGRTDGRRVALPARTAATRPDRPAGAAEWAWLPAGTGRGAEVAGLASDLHSAHEAATVAEASVESPPCQVGPVLPTRRAGAIPRVMVAAGVALLVVAGAALYHGHPAPAQRLPVRVLAAASPPPTLPELPPPGPSADEAPAPPPVAAPTKLDIPALKIAGAVDPAGMDPDGAISAPADFARLNWYTGYAAPGEPGPAVIVGHLDSYTGPAVFYRLEDLRPNDTIDITRADGTLVRFSVDRSASYPKADFPTVEVFGPRSQAELRLITCTGSFDRRHKRYRDNLVVFAHQIAT